VIVLSPTIKDVASLAGVSVATVSRHIHQNSYISESAEQKVINAINELGYKPVRNIRNKKMMTIGLVIPDITNPFFSELARAIEDACQEKGFAVLFCNSDQFHVKEKLYIEFFMERNVSGTIFATNNLSPEEYNKLTDAGIPIVVLDRIVNNPLCTSVKCNNYEGAKLAVKHLLETGCKKIAHIYGPQEITTGNERLQGYIDVVKDEPWYTPTLLAPGYFEIEGGMEAVETLLSRHPDIDGIFAGNDIMALGILKTLKRKNIKVPEEIAVCGFDGISFADIFEPGLTTIAQPIYEMGKKAAEILIDQINHHKPMGEQQAIEMNVELVVRESTQR